MQLKLRTITDLAAVVIPVFETGHRWVIGSSCMMPLGARCHRGPLMGSLGWRCPRIITCTGSDFLCNVCQWIQCTMDGFKCHSSTQVQSNLLECHVSLASLTMVYVGPRIYIDGDFYVFQEYAI